jgi:SAM-dependent methyltransferase
VLRALAAQGLVFLALAALAAVLPRLPIGAWILLQGLGSTALGGYWGLGPWWWLFQLLLPFALAWQLGHSAPGGLYLALLAGLLLVFGGGVWTRVPLYNSGPAAWHHLLPLIPQEAGAQVADLGAGLGGPLAYLARRRPDAQFVGVEASPLVWLVAWLRTWPRRRNCRMRWGSLWRLDLRGFDLVFAFLSPAPMEALWRKALLEMRPGTLLVSHTFEIPGVEPEARIPVPGRPGACLLLYRVPGQN